MSKYLKRWHNAFFVLSKTVDIKCPPPFTWRCRNEATICYEFFAKLYLIISQEEYVLSRLNVIESRSIWIIYKLVYTFLLNLTLWEVVKWNESLTLQIQIIYFYFYHAVRSGTCLTLLNLPMLDRSTSS